MRTTIDIGGDVLDAANALARRENASAGQVVSRIRDALTGRLLPSLADAIPTVAGFRAFAAHPIVVTDEDFDHLRDQEGI